jgi:hypothetical protein
MTNTQRTICLREIKHYTDRDAYISDLALSSMWGDAEDAEIPAERVTELGDLWDAFHRPVREIAAAAGLSQRKLAERFCIPYPTMERWCGGRSACPVYTRLMMQEILGLC